MKEKKKGWKEIEEEFKWKEGKILREKFGLTLCGKYTSSYIERVPYFTYGQQGRNSTASCYQYDNFYSGS